MSAPEQDPNSNSADTSILVSYFDSLGQHVSPVRDPTAESLLAAGQWVYWPPAASMLLLSHLANHPVGRFKSPLGETPLAVLYTPPDLAALSEFHRVDEDGTWIEPGRIVDRWEAVLLNLLGAIGANPARLELVRLGRRARHAHPTFRLPLRIAVIGSDSERLADWLRAEPAFGVDQAFRFREAFGVWQSESILSYGLEIVYLGDIPSRSMIADWDIILLRDRDDVGTIAGRLSRLSIDSRPRLMILLRSGRDPYRQDRRSRYRGDLPPGVAALYIDAGDDYECLRLLTAFIQALMHDLPLHQAVATARRDETVSRLNASAWSIGLSGTEESLNSIRMMDAYIDLQQRAFQLLAKGGIGQPTELGRHGRAPIIQRNVMQLQRFAELRVSAARAVDNVADAFFSFHHESDGLWPVAGYLAEVEAASAALDIPAAALAQLREDPDLSAALALEQERHVSVWLTAMFDEGPSAVRSDRWLIADQVYLLNAAIGVHWPTDLVDSSTPPIDPLLPPLADDESYRLQFVLFGIDFTALSDTVVDVTLPQHGASDLASFLIRSPSLSTETAELRLILYHNNNVLQTFRLTAKFGPTEESAGPSVVVRMDFSQANFFRDVAETQPRFLSIASNEDASGTHRLFMNGAVPTTVPISEASGREVIKRFRQLLGRAAERNEDEKALWELAQLGSRIYNQLLIDADTEEFEEHLKALQVRRGEVIQVIRLAANFPYPWPVVYDWLLPEDPSPMCLGSCEHTPADEVFCANGFWGARLVVEEFIKDKNVQRALSVRSGQGQPTCIVTVGKRATDRYTRDLVDHLMATDAPFMTIEADLARSVLEQMWDDTSRPAIFVVIGHTTAGSDSLPSIAIDTIDRAISSQAIMRFVRKATGRRWIDPKTFIFLMACDSATTDLEHLSDVMTGFITAGAGAVVGAEVKVSTLEVSAFLTTVFTELAQGRSLGESVSEFRLGRLRVRRPDAFSFNAFGSADAHLAW
jgi:hypothetical protein